MGVNNYEKIISTLNNKLWEKDRELNTIKK